MEIEIPPFNSNNSPSFCNPSTQCTNAIIIVNIRLFIGLLRYFKLVRVFAMIVVNMILCMAARGLFLGNVGFMRVNDQGMVTHIGR